MNTYTWHYDRGEVTSITWTWHYNGVAPWIDILRWCNDNLKHVYAYSETLEFRDEQEFTMFLLRWS